MLESDRKTIKSWAKLVHQTSVDHGWWPTRAMVDIVRSIPEKLCLIHSEVSEALEVFRDSGNGLTVRLYDDSKGDNKPIGFESELADIVIRVFDLAEALNIDIERAIAEKHAYNVTRPYRHGGKRA